MMGECGPNEGRTAEAIGVDLATDAITAEISAFEDRYDLSACP